MALTAPTPPTPPTIDKGDLQTSSPRIDAHQFFEIPEMPFKKVESNGNKVDDDEENLVSDKPVTAEKNSVQNPATEINSGIKDNANLTNRQEVTPEDMARDAVANGSGALTRRTVTRAEDESNQTSNNAQTSSNESVPIIQRSPTYNASSDRYERGQAVLREFRDEDRSFSENSRENAATTSATPNFQHNSNYEESHGGFFWIATLIFVLTATFFVAKKFLFRSKPALRKSDLFVNSSEKLKSTAEKFSKPAQTSTAKKNSTTSKTANPTNTSKPVDKPKVAKKSQPLKSSKVNEPPIKKTPPVKPVNLPKKEDDSKGKHFEIRV